jgi:nucleoside-diphosphate-sugar epimerase
VDDVVSGIITLAEAGAAGIFELGSGKEYANIEVLELVERLSGRHANITLVDSLRPYDTTGWVSTGRSARDYGWRPAKSLEQSIMEMITRFQDENRAE